jgi:hypothetical protein
MRVGCVGNGTDKFTELGKQRAMLLLVDVIHGSSAMVSGHSPVGGIDIWAEEVAEFLGVPLDLKIPEVNAWNPPGRYGYMKRNVDIAKDSDILHMIVADKYPNEYRGRRFALCYHHNKGEGAPVMTPDNHVKSGGCWTAKKALELGKEVVWHIVENF